jgi:hypothetical protein
VVTAIELVVVECWHRWCLRPAAAAENNQQMGPSGQLCWLTRIRTHVPPAESSETASSLLTLSPTAVQNIKSVCSRADRLLIGFGEGFHRSRLGTEICVLNPDSNFRLYHMWRSAPICPAQIRVIKRAIRMSAQKPRLPRACGSV